MNYYFRSNKGSIEIQGFDDIGILARGLDGFKLPTEDFYRLQESREIKNALNEAGKYLVRQGKSRLKERLVTKRSERTGLLLRSLSHKVKKRNAGVIVGFRKDNKHSSLSWFIDKGTDSRKTDKGYNRGAVRPTYFWSETREQDADHAQDIVVDCIRREVDRIKQRYYNDLYRQNRY